MREELTKLYREGFRFLVRNKDGKLYAWQNKPEKFQPYKWIEPIVWVAFQGSSCEVKLEIEGIKWEDESPIEISRIVREL